MATSSLSCSTKGLLAEDSRPSEKLLKRIARHILVNCLDDIALEIGMDEAKYSHIKRDFRGESEAQIYQVTCIHLDLETNAI